MTRFCEMIANNFGGTSKLEPAIPSYGEMQELVELA